MRKNLMSAIAIVCFGLGTTVAEAQMKVTSHKSAQNVNDSARNERDAGYGPAQIGTTDPGGGTANQTGSRSSDGTASGAPAPAPMTPNDDQTQVPNGAPMPPPPPNR